MYVIMTEDRKCVVKGKTRKYLCGVEEKTAKQLLTYDTHQQARSAVMRIFLLQGAYAAQLYGGAMPRLEIVEV